MRGSDGVTRGRACAARTYAVPVSGLLLGRFVLPVAPPVLPVLLLLPEALLLLQSQRDPQGPGLLLLRLGAVQRVPALQRGFICGTF